MVTPPLASAGPRGSMRPAFAARLAEAVPPLRTAIAGAILWGAIMGASALLSLLLGAWQTPASVRLVSGLFAVAGALAFPCGLFFARLVSARRRADTRFAAAFVSFALMTIVWTAGIYALQYRVYYMQWHADIFSFIWLLQLIFTGLAALYQFAVLGMRMFFPLGFIALFAVSAWFALARR